MRTLILLLFSVLYLHTLTAQADLLQSGPMLGYTDMREALLWVQTKQAAEVQFAYWDTLKPQMRYFTDKHITRKQDAYTAKLVADRLEPAKVYGYELLINGQVVSRPYPTIFRTQALWRFRTDPPPFTVAIGSCTYVNEVDYDRPGRPYGAEYQIFKSIYDRHPDLMLWLGDNIYLREGDYYTRTGVLHRNTHTRSLTELQPLLASTHHYAIWDDHDFGPNDSDRSFSQKDLTLEAFNLFWGNPTAGVYGEAGTTSWFEYQDMHFFMLDNRYHRSPNDRKTGDCTVLGEAQREWLIDALAASAAPFKLVAIGGQVLNTATVFENYANVCPEEREWLLKRIEEENIKGVVFLTGDRHHTELSKYTNAAGNEVYDVTISPLTSGPAFSVTDINQHRVDNTLVTKRNFGLLSFSGPRTARELLIQVFDSSGEELWQHQIKSASGR